MTINDEPDNDMIVIITVSFFLMPCLKNWRYRHNENWEPDITDDRPTPNKIDTMKEIKK